LYIRSLVTTFSISSAFFSQHFYNITANGLLAMSSSIDQPEQSPLRTRSTKIHPHALLALTLLVTFLLGCGLISDATTTTSAPNQGDAARVIRIVDGDTIEVTLNGRSETVRYVGIDTPERGQPGYRAATEANRAFVEGETVYLSKDRTDVDAFRRLLRYVFLEDGTLVNAQMIADGWAQPVEYKPDVARAEQFFQLALEAAEAKRGFWSGDSSIDGAMSYALTTREAELRQGPGSDYKVSSRIPPNTPLTLFGRSPNNRWLQVRLPNRDGGWVSNNALEANVPIASIPLGEVDGVQLIGATPTPGKSNSGKKCPEGCLVPPEPVCNIKGNVNSTGEKIYHLPGTSLYTRTNINTDEGDRWFCTGKEAEGAGFRGVRR
jgi:endonuclease YncB( thermonuclease family)